MKFPEKCKISPIDLQFPKLALVMIPNKKKAVLLFDILNSSDKKS